MIEEEKARQFEEPPVVSIEDIDFSPPTYIQLSRIYDMLTLIAMSIDAEGAWELIELHRQGRFKGPAPSMTID